MAEYYNGDKGFLMETLRLAAEYHDLGKLDQSNQEVLMHHPSKSLPVNHWDAGVAHLAGHNLVRQLAALSVYSHHVGLPDIQDMLASKEEDRLRDTDIRRRTDRLLETYLATHRQAMAFRHGTDEQVHLEVTCRPPAFCFDLPCPASWMRTIPIRPFTMEANLTAVSRA